MMVTGGHGVRMQYDYTGDAPGLAGAVSAASPRWLRLTRSGDTFTGYDSADGTHWTKVGVVTLTGLPSTVQGGLFATSPPYCAGIRGRHQRDRRRRARRPAPSTTSACSAAGRGAGWTGTAIGDAGGPAAGSPGGFQDAAPAGSP